MITVDFNENVYSANMQNFMTEIGVFEVFQEINGVEPKQREAAREHWANAHVMCWQHKGCYETWKE